MNEIEDTFIKSWLDSYPETTKKTYQPNITDFFNFLNQTWPENSPWNGTKIHDDRKASQRSEDETVKFKYEDVTVKYANWLRTKKSSLHPELTLSDYTVVNRCVAVSSFLNYMRMPLVLNRPQKRAILQIGKPRNMPYRLSLADITAMKKQANTKERYILLVGKSLGLRVSDFISLRQGLFEGNLKDREAPYSLGVITTQKRKADAYPFLDYEAHEAYLNYRQELQATNRWDGKDRYMLQGTKPDSHMTKQEVNGIIKKLSTKAGLRLGNLHLSFHCFRRFLCDHLSTAVGDANKWKQVVGKKISEGAYISSDDLREAYAKVMRYTCEERTVRLGDVSDLRQIVDELVKDKSYLESEVKELKDTMQMAIDGLPKSILEVAQDLISRGVVPPEMVERVQKESVESAVRTKEVMEQALWKDYGLRVRKVEQKTLA